MRILSYCLILIVIASFFSNTDAGIRISRRKLKLLKKLAMILILGKNKKIYTFPFPLPLPLPVITKTQPIIYRQKVPYPVEVPVPVPYAEPVPYPVEVPVSDNYDDEPYPEDSYIDQRVVGNPYKSNQNTYHDMRYQSGKKIQSRRGRVYRD